MAIEKRERTLVSNHAISPVDVCELSGLKLIFKSDLDTNVVKFLKAKSKADTKGLGLNVDPSTPRVAAQALKVSPAP